MATFEQEKVAAVVNEIPPSHGDELVAWVLMAEWREEDGQTKLTRLISSDSSAWQAKGYLHEGLNSRWPTAGPAASQSGIHRGVDAGRRLKIRASVHTAVLISTEPTAGLRGSQTQKIDPSPSEGSSQTLPPIASAAFRQM